MVFDYDYYDDESGDSNGGVDGTDDEKRESSRIEGADCLQGAEGQNAPGVTNDKLQIKTKISDGGETDDGDETDYHDPELKFVMTVATGGCVKFLSAV